MKGNSTKERILYAALDLFAQKGYDGVGVDLIAEKAGLKGPSLYRHYKGKEDIFNSLIDLVMFHYEEGFGLKKKPGEFPKSIDELIENAMEKLSLRCTSAYVSLVLLLVIPLVLRAMIRHKNNRPGLVNFGGYFYN